MAAELSVYTAVTLAIDGKPWPDFGTIRASVKGTTTALTGGANPVHRRVLVPAATKVTVWEWADTEGFALLAIRPVGGAGFVQIGLRYNAPTSDTDPTPTGTLHHWIDVSKSCVDQFSLDSDRRYIHATAATEVAQSGSGTYPGVWDEAGRVYGVCDAIAVFNENADDACYVDVLVIPN